MCVFRKISRCARASAGRLTHMLTGGAVVAAAIIAATPATFAQSSPGPAPKKATAASKKPVTPAPVKLVPQQQPQEPETLAVTSASTPSYRIEKEDVLDVVVTERPEYSKSAEVLPDGTISYPRLGQVYVVGMTLGDLERRIFKELDRLFVNPEITVSVRQRRVRQVSIVGDGIRQAGKQVMRDGWRVLDVIAAAGGLVTSRPELLSAHLLKPKEGGMVAIDLKKLMANDATQNLLVEQDDVLTVQTRPVSETQVQVLGQVGKPGSFVYPEDASVIRLITEAGGPTAAASLSEATIERSGKTIKVDLREAYRSGTDPEGVSLLPGDRLVIPENKRYVYVFGAVGKPGMMVYPDDRKLTVASILGETIVSVQNAEYKRTQLMRQKADGTAQTTIVNGEELIDKGNFSLDVPVEPGDVVYVPFKKGRRSILGESMGLINVLPALGWLFNGGMF